jgi:hypothetical protein
MTQDGAIWDIRITTPKFILSDFAFATTIMHILENNAYFRG